MARFCSTILFSFCLFFLGGICFGDTVESPPVIATIASESHVCSECGKEHSILTVTDTLTPRPKPKGFFAKRKAKRQARRAGRSMSDPQVSIPRGSDQSRAEAEAREMARLDYKGHLAGTIGNFEGVGWACGDTPGTCTPAGRLHMTLTGDAIASSDVPCKKCNQMVQYRVRSWRK